MGPVTQPDRAADAVRMCEIVFGKEFVHDNAVMVGLVNGNSPLVWDATMIGALRVYARSGQALVVAPFTLAGANTPASATATVAELMAEALSAIAYAQLERPGAKMILGSFLAAVSMKSGAPMAGTGELGLMNLMIGQLARRYRLPWRSSGMLTGSKVTDAQAGYESAFNMFPIMLAGANYVMHCAGWTEAGLTASYAKFMLDAEQMEMLWKFGHGPRFEDFDEAVATIGQVGPGGHFLGTAHTQAHFQDAFFMSELFDNNSFEQWLADGEKDAATRGLEAAQEGAGRLRRRRRSTPASTRRWPSSSPGASASCPTSRIEHSLHKCYLDDSTLWRARVATLIVRRVDERLVAALKARAHRHGRSAEAEHRAILEGEFRGLAPSSEELLAYFRLGAELGLGEVEIGRDCGGPVEPQTLG